MLDHCNYHSDYNSFNRDTLKFMNNYQAAIFDMDGLLLDTERVCMGIFKEACTVLSLPFFDDVYLSIIGRNAAGIRAVFADAYGDRCDALIAQWRSRYHKVVAHQAIPVKPGVVELLQWLQSRQIPLAVATSTASPVAEQKLKLAGLDRFFQALATGCEVSCGKPDPEIYLLAAERLNVDPLRCLAFEDSNHGVRAAVSAQMFTYQIPDLVQPCEGTRCLGHRILPDLLQVLEELR